MPFISVKLVQGKPEGQKQRLLKEITRVTADELSIDANKVVVVLEEISAHQWARGGITVSQSQQSAPSADTSQ